MVGSAVAVGTTAYGAYSASKGAKGAAGTMGAGAAQANQLLEKAYKEAKTNLSPYVATGSIANTQLGNLLGLTSGKNYIRQRYLADNKGKTPETWADPEVQAKLNVYLDEYNDTHGQLTKSFGMEDFQASPDFQFRLDEGAKALNRSMAAKGGLLSGAATKALTSFNSNLASQEYDNAYGRFTANQTNLYNRLMGVSQQGQNAATTLASQGQNTASQQAGYLTDAATGRAAAQVQNGNTWGSFATNPTGGQTVNQTGLSLLPESINWNSGRVGVR